jgi:hypothetical protein
LKAFLIPIAIGSIAELRKENLPAAGRKDEEWVQKGNFLAN